ncbi:L-asparaginase [Streptosporangium becharense]|uniref:L-asparaginase n=1 Tax=Streptosporangium becharense TaxID=1816182 RepID=A0A7W9MH26_9ACTN|nr:asparaginase [Streptosporangium becharense]MBB2908876.1 L-asparaginase [Streptosporangium becharense]MBB5820106.1 L-asparaginase [Streptosporangium becharense]
MKRVLLLATGDTIAYSHGPGRSSVASGAELLRTVPAGALTADVVVEDVPAEPSWDMSPSTMLALARRARSALLGDGFDGVVITHGTDALEETAYLVDLLAGGAAERGGIVLTGAIRSLDELSGDGPRNLAASVTVAADGVMRGAGAVVCVNDEVHAARWVTEVDAASVAAFSSAPFPPLGRVIGGRVQTLAAPPPRPPMTAGEPASDVALIKTYPGMDSVLLTAVVDAGAQGIVLEGTGMGNVPVSLLSTIAELTEWGIPVVVASRCRTPATPLEDLPPGTGLAATVGAIGARGLAPAKARCALMVALATGGVDAVRDWFVRL